MMTVSAISASTDMGSYYGSDDYYSASASASAWGGAGAEKAGLSGAVQPADLERIYGKSEELKQPDGGGGGGNGNHRRGWDVTFSPPKSVSLQALVEGDIRIVKAHHQAVDAVLGWVEQRTAMTRLTTDGKTETVKTGNLLYAKFDHTASREGDPQLHTHVLVANVTHTDRGWRSLYMPQSSVTDDVLYRIKHAGTEVYRTELTQGLERLGYDIDYRPDGTFEIAGYKEKTIDHFSKRTDQIQEHYIIKKQIC